MAIKKKIYLLKEILTSEDLEGFEAVILQVNKDIRRIQSLRQSVINIRTDMALGIINNPISSDEYKKANELAKLLEHLKDRYTELENLIVDKIKKQILS